MYQLGVFYPFFRAHNEINYQFREPWLQNERIQAVVRGAIELRYELIHYIYTTFYQASKHGEPIVRAMWYEFPEDVDQIDDDSTQFMFGDSLLICPKLTNSTIDEETGDHIFPIDCVFPKEALWYFWYAPIAFQGSSERQFLELNDLEQGIWVKGGSIIPSLYRFDAMSLLHALTNPMSLGIYLDER